MQGKALQRVHLDFEVLKRIAEITAARLLARVLERGTEVTLLAALMRLRILFGVEGLGGSMFCLLRFSVGSMPVVIALFHDAFGHACYLLGHLEVGIIAPGWRFGSTCSDFADAPKWQPCTSPLD